MATQANIPDLLRATPLFGPLSDEERAGIARQMRPASFHGGQMIFSRGDQGTDIYLVLTGRVRLSVLSHEGRELSFSHAGAGDVFGEIAALDAGRRTADATAVSATKAVTLSHTAVRRMIETSPSFARAAIGFLCSRLRDADLQLENVALHSIEVRLARFLLGQLKQSRADSSRRETIRLEMSQGELALLLGASRPKVNAALALLEAEGAISRRDNTIECSSEDLRRLAEVE